MFLIKLLALPLIIAVTLIQWVAIFLTSFSAILFDLLAGIIFMITLAGLMFGVCTGMEALKMLAVSFAIFIIPQIAEWLIERIVDINYGLRDFIKSCPDNFKSFTKRQVFLWELSAAFIFINFKEDYFMKMSIGEKKILFVFGCPNREATMDRLYQVADLIPDPAGKKVVEALADKLDSEGVEKWYRCFFYNMKLEMEAYYRHKAILNRIVGGSMEVDNDEIDED